MVNPAQSSDALLLPTPQLPLRTKLAYGLGETASSAITNLRVFFLLYFLTNVAGLNAALAGTVLLLGRIWDAVNDPIIGWLSDRTRSPWGKRHAWMIWGAIPFGLFCFLQWVVPTLGLDLNTHQGRLFWYYVIVSLLFDTAYTAVVLPYSALAPELTPDYNERTSLISIQMAFSVAAGIGALVLAQVLFAAVADTQQQYRLLGGICALFSVLVIYLCVWGTRDRTRASSNLPPVSTPFTLASLWANIQSVWGDRAFQLVTGTYVLAWVSVQVSAAVLPYYVQVWMQLPETHVTQMAIAVQLTTFVMIFVWSYISRRIGKKVVFFWAIPVLVVSQTSLYFLQPGQLSWMYICGVGIGVGLAAIYLVPWSMLPDVIDGDELKTGQRREGLFYGFMVQLQKVGLAIALFLVGKGLDWAGYIPSQGGASIPAQPAPVLQAIRLEMGPLPTLAVIASLVLVSFYPITQAMHAEIRLRLIEQQRALADASNGTDRPLLEGGDR